MLICKLNNHVDKQRPLTQIWRKLLSFKYKNVDFLGTFPSKKKDFFQVSHPSKPLKAIKLSFRRLIELNRK